MKAVCFDLETVNPDKDGTANTDTSDIVQVAAVPVDLDKLVVLEDEALDIIMKPKDINSKTFLDDYSNVIKFHCEVHNKTPEEMVEFWKMGVKEEAGFKEFISYVKEWKDGSKPIALTQNGRNFDDPIVRRKCKEYKQGYPFHLRDQIDMIEVFGWWFRYAANPPKNYKMDTVLPHLGMSCEGSHNALVDVINTANVALRFLKLQKKLMTSNANWVPVLNGCNALGA